MNKMREYERVSTYAGYFPLWKVLSSGCVYKDSFLLHNDYMPDIRKRKEAEIH